MCGQRANKQIETEPSVVKLAELAGVSAAEYAKQADKLIERCNNAAAHEQSCAKLEIEVEACQELITDEMQQKHMWECWVVTHYARIKEAFPTQFV